MLLTETHFISHDPESLGPTSRGGAVRLVKPLERREEVDEVEKGVSEVSGGSVKLHWLATLHLAMSGANITGDQAWDRHCCFTA